eukprot:8531913-Pyramimonas_sp.AAC.1
MVTSRRSPWPPPFASPALMPHLYVLPHLLIDLTFKAHAQVEPPPDAENASIDHEGIPNPTDLDLALMGESAGNVDLSSSQEVDFAMSDD